MIKASTRELPWAVQTKYLELKMLQEGIGFSDSNLAGLVLNSGWPDWANIRLCIGQYLYLGRFFWKLQEKPKFLDYFFPQYKLTFNFVGDFFLKLIWSPWSL
jgi:hypothetical protein